MKLFNSIFAVIFLGFAALQYNDPDPLVWISIYMAMVVFCIRATRQHFSKIFTIILIIVYVGYSAILSPALITWLQSPDRGLLFDDLAKMQFIYIEETREFLGLMICLAVIGLNYLLKKEKQDKKWIT